MSARRGFRYENYQAWMYRMFYREFGPQVAKSIPAHIWHALLRREYNDLWRVVNWFTDFWGMPIRTVGNIIYYTAITIAPREVRQAEFRVLRAINSPYAPMIRR